MEPLAGLMLGFASAPQRPTSARENDPVVLLEALRVLARHYLQQTIVHCDQPCTAVRQPCNATIVLPSMAMKPYLDSKNVELGHGAVPRIASAVSRSAADSAAGTITFIFTSASCAQVGHWQAADEAARRACGARRRRPCARRHRAMAASDVAAAGDGMCRQVQPSLGGAGRQFDP